MLAGNITNCNVRSFPRIPSWNSSKPMLNCGYGNGRDTKAGVTIGYLPESVVGECGAIWTTQSVWRSNLPKSDIGEVTQNLRNRWPLGGLGSGFMAPEAYAAGGQHYRFVTWLQPKKTKVSEWYLNMQFWEAYPWWSWSKGWLFYL